MYKPAHKTDRERFPEIEEAIGEDPARYLDAPLVERGPDHTSTTNRDLALARIRGIDKLGVVNGWIQVERELDRGPREPVLTLLERHRDRLIEFGDRELPGLSREELRALNEDLVDEEDEPDPIWRHEGCGTTDVERECSRTWFCHTCDQRTNRVEEVNDPEEPDEEPEIGPQAVATDGGDQE